MKEIKNVNIKAEKEITKLDKCINAPHAEMVRNRETDEPCEAE